VKPQLFGARLHFFKADLGTRIHLIVDGLDLFAARVEQQRLLRLEIILRLLHECARSGQHCVIGGEKPDLGLRPERLANGVDLADSRAGTAVLSAMIAGARLAFDSLSARPAR
jgi:hypothetical protein